MKLSLKLAHSSDTLLQLKISRQQSTAEQRYYYVGAIFNGAKVCLPKSHSSKAQADINNQQKKLTRIPLSWHMQQMLHRRKKMQTDICSNHSHSRFGWLCKMLAVLFQCCTDLGLGFRFSFYFFASQILRKI